MQPTATTDLAAPGWQPRREDAFDRYLTYCAIGGLTVSDEGNITTMTLEQFCAETGIDRATTWRWKKNIKNFAQMVRSRRDEIVPLARETAALNRLFVIGMSSIGPSALHHDQRAAGDALKTYLGHHSRLRLPTQPHEIEAGRTLMDLVNTARNKNVIEGEVVGRNDDNAGGSAPADRGVSEASA